MLRRLPAFQALPFCNRHLCGMAVCHEAPGLFSRVG